MTSSNIEAKSLIVTTADDVVNDTDGVTSLREAIAYANEKVNANSTTPDVITFDQTVFNGTNRLIRLTLGELVITDAVKIDASSVGGVTITGDANGDDVTVAGTDITDVEATGADLLDDNSRIFNITSSSAYTEISGLTLTGGRATGAQAYGGAVMSQAKLDFYDSTLTGNIADGIQAKGGAVWSQDAVRLYRSTVSDNTAVGTLGGGGSDYGGAASGGGVASGTSVRIYDSTLSGNHIEGEGSVGGGVASVTVDVVNSTVSGNWATGHEAKGGGVWANIGSYLVHATVTGNSVSGAGSYAGGIGGLELYLNNSIVLGNDSSTGIAREFDAALSEAYGMNILGTGADTAPTAGDYMHADPTQVFAQTEQNGSAVAGVLADNGGPVQTVALAAFTTNPAIDATSDTGPDARGYSATDIPNLGAGGRDLGAYEVTGNVINPLLVTTEKDVVDADDGVVSLREAITYANQHANANTPDVITFDSSVFTGSNKLIRLTNGELTITDAVKIDASSVHGVTITGDKDNDDVTLAGLEITDVKASGDALLDDNSRIFNITGANSASTFDSLTLTGGRTTASGQNGGAVRSDAVLNFYNSAIAGNSTAGSGANGGGLAGTTITLTNSTVAENFVANGQGGGIYSVLMTTLVSSTVTGNASSGNGGGVSAAATVMANSILLGNDSAATTNDNIYGPYNGSQGKGIIEANIDGSMVIKADPTRVFAQTTVNGATRGGVLADNGGPVPTVALLAYTNNPAIDASSASATASDARGTAATNIPAVGSETNVRDIGAYEVTGKVIDPLLVTTDKDVVDADDGVVSLREAIDYANKVWGTDTITFDASVFDGQHNLIRLTNGELKITDSIKIDATSVHGVTITGDKNDDDVTVAGTDITDVKASGDALLDDNSRIFNITGGTGATLESLTLTGGRTTGDNQNGGAVFSASALTLNHSAVVGNSTAGDGSRGGAIYAQQGVTIYQSTVTGNSTTGNNSSGGAIGTNTVAIITDSTVSDNSTSGSNSMGGGILAFIGAELTNSVVSGNSTEGNGSVGGGLVVDLGDARLTNTTIADNHTTGPNASGGGIYSEASSVILKNSTITGNSVSGPSSDGGGISGSTTLTNSIVLGNNAAQASGDEISGTYTANGLNILGTGNDTNASDGIINADPTQVFAQTTQNGSAVAGVLGDNGGPVQTVKLLSSVSNPALDASNASGTTMDARNFTAVDIRSVGSATNVRDLGAYEITTQEARSLVVTTTEDVVDAFDGKTSLREALAYANDKANAGANTPDVITFDGTVFADGNAHLIRLTKGELTITDAVKIDASSVHGVTITGDKNDDDVTVAGTDITDAKASIAAGKLGDNSRIFNITGSSSSTELNGLTLTGGRTTANDQYGGAVRSDAKLTLDGSTVSGNSTAGERAYGGGLFSDVTVVLKNSTVSDNMTTGNTSSGGGVLARDSIVLDHSTISGNSTAGISAVGGGLSTATLTGSNSTISDNHTVGRGSFGGGAYTKDGGLTATTISGNSTAGDSAYGGGLYINGGLSDTFTLTNSTVANNLTADSWAFGGGISSYAYLLALVNSTVTGNSTSGSGALAGGIYGNLVTLTNSIVLGNDSVQASSDEIMAAVITNGTNIVGTGSDTDASDGIINADPTKVFAQTTTSNGVVSGVLAANGGPVETVALLASGVNPALDASNAAGTATDARGVAAANIPSLGSATNVRDLGAYEVNTQEARSLVVNTTSDVVDAFDGKTSLREAIIYANEKANADANTPDVITFDATAFGDGKSHLIRLQNGELKITDAVKIDASGVHGVTITGDKNDDDVTVGNTDITDVKASGKDLLDDNSRIFSIAGYKSETTLDNLTLTGGRTTADGANGGAILSDAALTLNHSTVSGNSTGGTGANGGAIASSILTANNSTISGNSTSGNYAAGGALYGGPATLNNTFVSGNSTSGESAVGGAMAVSEAILDHSTVSGNSTAGKNANGGGIYAIDRTTMTASTVSDNHATGQGSVGGGLYSNVTVVTGSTVSGNSTNGNGGGLYIIEDGSLTAFNSTIANNEAYNGRYTLGGGIYQEQGGSVALTNTTMTGNVATSFGAIVAQNVTLTNSILLGNGNGDDPPGNLTLHGVNIIGNYNDSDASDGRIGADPTQVFAQTTTSNDVVSGVLGDNGGPVETVALLASSVNPALDASNSAGTATDARGEAAFDIASVGSATNVRDLGAYELNSQETRSLVVNTTEDVVDAFDGVTSLREAIIYANEKANADADTPDVITFDATAFGDGKSHLIRLQNGELKITDAVKIDASGVHGVTITGDKNDDDVTVGNTDITDVKASGKDLLDDNSRIFNISGSTSATTLDSLTLTGGRTTAGTAKGGAILSDAALTLNYSIVAGNSTSGDASIGGGIYGASNLTLNHSTVAGNSTGGIGAWCGGAFAGHSLILNDSLVTGNSTSGGGASTGGVGSMGTVELNRSTVTGNATYGEGGDAGGVFGILSVVATDSVISNNHTIGVAGSGGGIKTQSLTLINSTVSGNSTSGDNSSGGGVEVYSAQGGSGSATLINSTITGNSTSGHNSGGGGIDATSVSLTNSIVLGNDSVQTSTDEISGTVTANGLNIVGTGSDTNASDGIINADPTQVFAQTTQSGSAVAGVLGDNGGPVQTVALLASGVNPAIDASDSSGSATDARGEVATNFPHVGSETNIRDLGAYEVTRAEPQSLVVNTTEDVVDAFDGKTSLREAIIYANEKANADADTPDVITFDATAFGDGESHLIRLQNGELTITDAVKIDASGVHGVTITGDKNGDDRTIDGTDITDVEASKDAGKLGDNSRIFNITGDESHTTLDSLTLTGGRTTGNYEYGGALVSAADVTLNDSTVSGNSTAGQGAQGGGIYAYGTLVLNGSSVTGNQTSGDDANGGGLQSSTAIILDHSTVSGNHTEGRGASGGGLRTDLLTSTNSVISDNHTEDDGSYGGGAYVESGSLTGTTVSGNSTSGFASQGGGIYFDGSSKDLLTLANSTVADNHTGGPLSFGGGISALDGTIALVNSTVTGNFTAGENSQGGGILGASVTLTNSIVLGNDSLQSDVDELDATVTANGVNIVGSGSDTNASDGIINADPTQVFAQTTQNGNAIAGVLADNGGPVQTVALLASGVNPALDASNAAGTATDARGVAAVNIPSLGGATNVRDLGAYEVNTQEARSLVVNTTSDVVDAFDGKTSLREAIIYANEKANADADTPDVITFDATAFGEGKSHLIRLQNGELKITDAVKIDVSGVHGVTITGDKNDDDVTVGNTDITDVKASGDALLDDNSRIFNITSFDAATTLDSLTLTGGRTTTDFAAGGAIRSNSDLILNHSNVSGNSTGGRDAAGGGIYAVGAVTLTDGNVSGNTTTGDNSRGGGVHASGSVTLTNAYISGNATLGDYAAGGGIYSLTSLIATASSVTSNTTAGDGSHGAGIAGGAVTLNDSTVSDNSTSGSTTLGGGLSGGLVTLNHSTVSGNYSTGYNGACAGIYAVNAIIDSSTISGNYTTGAKAVVAGIGVIGDISLTNSTVADNHNMSETDPRVMQHWGGGIVAIGNANLVNSTVTGNSIAGENADGGGIRAGSVTLTNSIVLGNSSPLTGNNEISVSSTSNPTITANGVNIVGTGSDTDASDGIINADPTQVFAQTTQNGSVVAGVLADNGGPVQTVALLVSNLNPAIDASNSAGTATDARGTAAVNIPSVGSDTNVRDLGAYELIQTAPVLDHPLTDQTVLEDSAFSYQIPKGSFADLDIGDTLAYTATLANNAPLPSWLSFDAKTGTFSGTPAGGDVGSITVRVTATDGLGAAVYDDFAISVTDVNDAPVLVASGTSPTFTENGAAVTLFEGVGIDLGEAGQRVTQLVLYVDGLKDGSAEQLVIDGTTIALVDGVSGTTTGAASVDYEIHVAKGTLTVVLDDTGLTEDQAEALIGSIAYRNISDDPSTSDRRFAIERIKDSGGTDNGGVDTTFTSIVSTVHVAAANDAPTVAHALVDQNATEDAAFSFVVPADSFADLDTGDVLRYSATLADGSALPAWLSFDAKTGTFSGTPANGDVGTITIRVTATDGSNASVSDDFTITVANTNDAPTVAHALVDQNATEDAAFSFVIPADAFADMDKGDVLTYTATLADGSALPAWLSFDAKTGTFSGTPQNGDVGAITVKVTATDGSNASVSDDFVITVGNVNDAPSGADKRITIDEDSSWSFRAGDFGFQDIDGNVLSGVKIAGLGQGTLRLDGAAVKAGQVIAAADIAKLVWTPAADVNGKDFTGFTFQVIDNGGTANGGVDTDPIARTIRFDVTPVNDAPRALNPVPGQIAQEDSAFAFQLPLGTFGDVDGDTLTYVATLSNGAALPAWLSFDPSTRTFSGTPANGDVGTITVQVVASDPSRLAASTVFTIAVGNVNDAPTVAHALFDQNATEDTSFSFVVPADAFADVDKGDALTYSATLADGSALPSWLSFDAKTGTFSGTPANGDVGAITVRVTATDGAKASVSDDFTLTIANTNDAPVVAHALADQNASEDTSFSFVIPADSFADVDKGDVLTYSATLADGAALPSWLSFDAKTGTFSGTPANGDVGAITVRVTATDGAKASVSDDFTLTIANTNDTPVVAHALADQNATEDTGFSFVIPTDAFADVDKGDALIYTATLADGSALPAWLSFDAKTGTFSGTPANGDVGSITVRVTATDGAKALVSDEFTLTVANTNDAPTVAHALVDQNATEDTGFSFVVPADSFADVDKGDALTYTATLADGSALPSWLSFDAKTQTFSGTPANGDVGSITVRVTATDGAKALVSDEFTLTVANTNDAPTVAHALVDQNATEDTGFSFVVPADSFADVDKGDVLTYSATLADGSALPAWLSFDAKTGTFSGTPTNGDVGSITVRVTATDGAKASVSDDFTLTVGAVNDAPVITGSLAATVAEGETHVLTLAELGASDPDDADETVSFTVSGLENGTLTVDGKASTGFTLAQLAAGLVAFAHDGSETTAAGFDVTVTDGHGPASAAAHVDLTVTPVDDAPVAADLVLNMIEKRSTTLDVLSQATDPDSTDLELTGAEVLSGHAKVRIGDDGELIIRHTADLKAGTSEIVEIRYTVSDGTTSDEGLVTISVSADGLNGNAGPDTLIGTAGNDVMRGKKGADLIRGLGGDDRLYGGEGADRIYGGAGNDYIHGWEGDDRLYGGRGRDILIGWRGDDLLTGGKGSDQFVFDQRRGEDYEAKNLGDDEITDFTVSGPDRDRIVIDRDFGIASFRELQDHIARHGHDTVITLNRETSITLDHIRPHELTAHSFEFV